MTATVASRLDDTGWEEDEKACAPVAARLGSGAEAAFALWRNAMLWQRELERALRPLRLTHTQLLVLVAVGRAFQDELGGARQAEIARGAGLDKVTTSRVLRTLESRCLVTRDIICDDHRSWSIVLTSRGEHAIRLAAPLAERAALSCSSG